MERSSREYAEEKISPKEDLINALTHYVTLLSNFDSPYSSPEKLISLVESIYNCRTAAVRACHEKFGYREFFTTNDIIEICKDAFNSIRPISLLRNKTLMHLEPKELENALRKFENDLEIAHTQGRTTLPNNGHSYFSQSGITAHTHITLYGALNVAVKERMATDRLSSLSFRAAKIQTELFMLTLATHVKAINVAQSQDEIAESLVSINQIYDAVEAEAMSALAGLILRDDSQPRQTTEQAIEKEEIRLLAGNPERQEPTPPDGAPTAATCTYQILSTHHLWNRVSAALYKPWKGAADSHKYTSNILTLKLLATVYLVAKRSNRFRDIAITVMSFIYSDVKNSALTNAMANPTLTIYAALFSTPPNSDIKLKDGQQFSIKDLEPLTKDSQDQLDAIKCDYLFS
jgi:hypothetical protein